LPFIFEKTNDINNANDIDNIDDLFLFRTHSRKNTIFEENTDKSKNKTI
jgi:hypothetical protein